VEFKLFNLFHARSLGDSVTFDAIGVTLTVDSIYERVDNAELNEFRQLQQGVVVKSSE
jgi:hypothetical protein